GVAQREDVHRLVAAGQAVVAGINHLPRTEQLRRAADGGGQADQVRVRLEAVGEHVAAQAAFVGTQLQTGNALASEPAVGGAAVGQSQLHDFEVVRSADRVHTRGGVNFVLSLLVRSVQLIVRQSDVQGAVHVAQAGGDATNVVGGTEANAIGVAGVVVNAERVADAELEAAVRRGLVHDHVVVANGVGSAQANADVGLGEAGAERIDRAEVLRRDVGLTTEVQTAPAVALQTDGGLTTEQTAALGGVTVAGAEAAFQLEHGLQAVTQIFGATQAPARTVLHAVDHADAAAAIPAVALDLVVADTGIDDAVQRHRGFCLGHTGETGEQGGSEQSLFHLRNLR